MRAKKQTTPSAFERGENNLTPETAAEVAELLADTLGGSYPDELAAVLLLCYSFTYERDMTTRENMLQGVIDHFGRWLPGFDEMCRAGMRGVLDALRKGGAK